jgi:hypothetical protein
MQLHDAVDALWIGRCAPVFFRLAAQQGMHAPIAIGWQVGDQPADIGGEFGVGQGRPPATPSFCWSLHCGEMRS